MKNKVIIVVGFIVLYLISTGVSYGAFSLFKSGEEVTTVAPTPANGSGFVIDTTAPKTEACPLNGEMRSKGEKDWWEKHRPLGIMIEDHKEARPQSGLSNADIVYEAVAEGGITRFLAVYYCQDSKMVGPVRSARTYFLDFISEYGDKPLYTHVGGANTPGPADALSQIDNYGWSGENDLNQFSIGFPTFWRDYERLPNVATEHTMYSTTTKLWKLATTRGLTNVDEKSVAWNDQFLPWKFKDDAKIADRPASFSVNFPFWEGYNDYSVKWIYDRETNAYKRENGGVAHLDKNTNSQLKAKDIILVYVTEQNADDGYENNAHLLYGTKGSGKATIIMDGTKIDGTWQKNTRVDRMKFFDSTGAEIELNRGPIWIEILPLRVKPVFK